MPDLYHYEPLPSSAHIRLISPQEPDFIGDFADITICSSPILHLSIITVDLTQELRPRYCALSYTWGNPWDDPPDSPRAREYLPTNRYLVTINGRLFFVGKSLYEALTHILQTTADKGIDVDRRRSPYKKTMLHEAAEEGRTDKVLHLVRSGADLSSRDCFGETPLHYAAENGHFEAVKVLIEYGADISLLDNWNRTPLACCEERKRGDHVEVAAFLHRPVRGDSSEAGKHEPDYQDIQRYFWIDALCVNQSDIAERNLQVAAMPQIFHAAQSVLAWLGPADEYTAAAFAAMNKDTERSSPTPALWVTPRTLDSNDNTLLHTLPRQNFEAFKRLLQRSWFRRIWIVQEIILGHKVTLTCSGSDQGQARTRHAISWSDFDDFFQDRFTMNTYNGRQLISTLNLPGTNTGNGERGTEALTLISIKSRTLPDLLEQKNFEEREMIDRSRLSSGRSRPSNLSALIIATWNFLATDPRDKIFALLNIAGPTMETRDLKADYSKSAKEIFTTVSHVFLQAWQQENTDPSIQEEDQSRKYSHHQLEPLEGLSFVQDVRSRNESLPSWVPDFGQPLGTERIWHKRFSADGGRFQQHLVAAHGDCLSLRGIYIDKVSTCEKDGIFPSPASVKSMDSQNWLDLASVLATIYQATGEDSIDALWRTLMTNVVWKSPKKEDITSASEEAAIPHVPDPDAAREAFRWAVRTSFARRHLHKPEWCNMELLESLLRARSSSPCAALPEIGEIKALLGAHERLEDARRIDSGKSFSSFNDLIPFPQRLTRHNFPHSCRLYYPTRRLFCTDSGLCGLAPESVREGDLVWLVAGARVPFVFQSIDRNGEKDGDRPADQPKRVRLVGEAYVHGIMNGEAAERRGSEDWGNLEID